MSHIHCLSVCVCVCVCVCLSVGYRWTRLYTNLLVSLHAPASAFRQPSPTCRTAFPAQHLRPSGVLSCWPDDLELTPGFIRDPTSSTDCFRRLLKRTCWRVTSASSALAVLDDYALYKSTHSLTRMRVMYLGHVLAKHTNIMTHGIHCISKSPLVNFWNNSVKN